MRDQFFIIDSNNMYEVTSRMYGYAVTDDKIFDNIHEFDEQKHKNSSGSFIAIKRDDDVIKFYQDNIGTYELFIYEDDNYFAIANSFILLYEYLLFEKQKKLNVNYEYIAHFLEDGFASIAYTATPCEQINLIPSKTTLQINIKNNSLQYDFPDLSSYGTVEIDSHEGQSIIENWINKWASIIKSAVDANYNISLDLSGGFDTRLTLALFLASGIDFAKINFNALSPAHAPYDFEIAKQLSQTFNFQLNHIAYPSRTMSHADSWNIALLTRFGLHSETSFANDIIQTYDNLQLSFTGFGGEGTLRGYWLSPVSELGSKLRNSHRVNADTNKLTRNFLAKELAKIHALLDNKFFTTKDDGRLLSVFYNESRLRHHFAVDTIERRFYNKFVLSPLWDEELKQLNLTPYEGEYRHILSALIFTKINKKLVDIPLNNKLLDLDCVQKAIKINELRSYSVSTRQYDINLKTLEFTDFQEFCANEVHPFEILKEEFCRPRTKSLVKAHFGEPAYDFLKNTINFQEAKPNRLLFIIFTMMKMLNYNSTAFRPSKLFCNGKSLLASFGVAKSKQDIYGQPLGVKALQNTIITDEISSIANEKLPQAKLDIDSLARLDKEAILPCLARERLTKYNYASNYLNEKLNQAMMLHYHVDEPCIPKMDKTPLIERIVQLVYMPLAELYYLRRSGCFDANYYLNCNPDVLDSGMEPLWHYISRGAKEGRNPAPWFDTKKYIAHDPSIVTCKLNPFYHYIRWGRKEGRVAHCVDTSIPISENIS